MSQRQTNLKANFTSGELKPELHAREDLGFYNNGAASIENMIVLPEGGVSRRPGTRFVAAVYNEAETGMLMPFRFSRTDSRIVCFNGGRGMVFKSGGFVETSPGSGVPYTFVTPWTAASLDALRWAEAADLVFVADGGTPKIIKRLADTNWTVTDYPATNGPVGAQNLNVAQTIGASATSGTITLTSNFDIFTAAHIGQVFRLDESDFSLISYWTASQSVTTGGAPDVSCRRFRGNVYEAITPTGTNGAFDCGVNAPTQGWGDFQSEPGKIIWRFRSADHGYVRVTAVAGPRSATATVIGVSGTGQSVLPDSVVSKPTYRWYEPSWSSDEGFPTVVAFMQQRVAWFNRFGRFWITESGDYYSFRVTTTDASAISGQMLSLDGSVVQPIAAISNGWIIVLAEDGEPIVRGPGAYDAITKNNVTAITDKGTGSAPHVPAIADAGMIFIGTSRERLHYAKTNRLIESINVDELSVASSHILTGLAKSVAYQHDPYRLVWGCSQDGALWSYTFRPDQQVIAAHRHPMPNAFVEDLDTMVSDDGRRVELWLLVRRIVNGQTRRFIEVLQPFFRPASKTAPTADGAWFYDCALEYVGPPLQTLSGLAHLAGAEVGVMLNGQDIGRRTVSAGGTISIPLLDAPTIRVVAGLPIEFSLDTLDMSPSANGVTTRGGVKKATHAAVDLLYGWGLDLYVDAGEGFGEAERLFDSGAEPLLGAPLPLFTGRKVAPLDSSHGTSVRLRVRGAHGYPLTLLGVAPDIELSES